MDNHSSPAVNPSLYPRGVNLDRLDDDAILHLRNLVPDDWWFIEECARRTRLGLWGYRPPTPAITPSSLAMENLPSLVLPEPLLPVVPSAADLSELPDEFSDRHGLERVQFFEERARWLSKFSPDDLINMWDETEAIEAQRAFPPGEDHEAQVRLWSRHQEDPSGTHTTAPFNRSRPQQCLTEANLAKLGDTSSTQRIAESAFLRGVHLRGRGASNEDGCAGNNGFSEAAMARQIAWALLPIINMDETPVESSGEESDFAYDTTLVGDSEDGDFDVGGDSGYDAGTDESDFADDTTLVGDSENIDFADDETVVGDPESESEYVFLANPPPDAYHSHLGGQLGLNLHVGRVELPEYNSPYGVRVTVREVSEAELSVAETEVSEDGTNVPPAPPPTEVDSEEQRAPIPSNGNRQLREHLNRDADIVLTFEDPEGQMNFVDEANGDVEYLRRENGINERSQTPTRNGRVPLREWNGLRRMGTRMPSPVSSNRTSGVRRRIGAVVDKVKKWLRK
jgi:hypothetical protein